MEAPRATQDPAQGSGSGWRPGTKRPAQCPLLDRRSRRVRSAPICFQGLVSRSEVAGGARSEDEVLMAEHTALEQAVRNAIDPSVLMGRLTRGLLTFVPQADGAVIELVDDLGLLTYVSAAGTLEGSVGTRLQKDGSLSGLAMGTGSILRCDETESDPRVDRRACRRLGIASMVCVPLVCGPDPIGVLKVSSRKPGAFSDAETATLAEVAGFVSTAVRSATEVARAMGSLLSTPTMGRSGAGVDQDLVSGADAVARFVGEVLRPGMVADVATRTRIEELLAGSAFAVVYQPIMDLGSGSMAAVEALARFPGWAGASTEAVFADATRVGLGAELELATVEAALRALKDLPSEVALAVNIGPAVVGDPWLGALVEAAGPRRIVLELTEHSSVDDYESLTSQLRALRRTGVRVSVDDAGSGYSSLTHILNLAPDFIKLDLQLTRGIDLDPVRRSLATALVSFANQSGAAVIAEGIETGAELQTLRRLGAHYGQGYYLGLPSPLEDLTLSSATRWIVPEEGIAPSAKAVGLDHELSSNS